MTVVPWCWDCGLDEHDSALFTGPVFDDDAYDLEILARRLPQARYDVADFAEVLGIRTTSLWTQVRRGSLPRADEIDDHVSERGVEKRAYWSPLTVAKVLQRRGAA
jgi:hypothetical protein